MSNYNSQEQTIYRNLAGKIQLGFYDDGARFPSAKEIAEMFQVSYCPAQRALKMLEAEGLIKLCRGKATIVLAKPFQNYLESDIFKRRSKSLLDLVKTIKLSLPPHVPTAQVIWRMGLFSERLTAKGCRIKTRICGYSLNNRFMLHGGAVENGQ